MSCAWNGACGVSGGFSHVMEQQNFTHVCHVCMWLETLHAWIHRCCQTPCRSLLPICLKQTYQEPWNRFCHGPCHPEDLVSCDTLRKPITQFQPVLKMQLWQPTFRQKNNLAIVNHLAFKTWWSWVSYVLDLFLFPRSPGRSFWSPKARDEGVGRGPSLADHFPAALFHKHISWIIRT